MRLVLPLLLCLVTAPVAAARATTRNVPADYPTIQAAIDAAANGDTVLVAPGTYVERINFKGKAILVTSSGGANVTTIDGNLLGSVVTFRNSEGRDSVLAGFTVTRGKFYGGGGGVDCFRAHPTIRDCTISDNQSSHGGGGVECFESNPTIRDCIISNNQTTKWGGGISAYMSDAIIEDNLITGNSAPWGGGIFAIFDYAPTIHGNTITENTAFKGGGIYCWDESRASIVANRIENNSSDLAGGIALDGCFNEVIGNTISGNRAPLWGGGGISTSGGRVTIHDNVICDNSSADNRGGGIYSQYGDLSPITHNLITRNSAFLGGGLALNDPGLVDHNTITFNHADDHGGGVTLATSGAFTFSNNVISDNSSKNGGGLWYYSHTLPDQNLAGNVLSRNQADHGGGICLADTDHVWAPVLASNCLFDNIATEGGGIYGGLRTMPVIALCTLSGNQAVRGGGVNLLNGSSIASSLLWGNQTSGEDPQIHLRSGSIEVTYSDVEGGYAGSGNIDADPLFTALAQGDFSLARTSPCVDRGDPASRPGGRDAAENARFLDGQLSRAMRVDMGAYEFTNVHFDVQGETSPGQTLTLTTRGLPGLLVLLLVARVPGETMLPPFGPLFFDLTGGFVAQPLLVIPDSGEVVLDVTIPATVPVPLPLVLQELALNVFTGAGNVSGSVAITIE